MFRPQSAAISSIFLFLSFFALSSCEKPAIHDNIVTGLIDATEIDIASKIPGRVKEINVREGDRVDAGQALLKLTSDEIEAKIAQVNAGIDASKAQLRLAKKGARPQEKRAVLKQLDAARHQVDITKKMYDRMLPLVQQQAISQSKFDEIEFKYNVAKDQLAMAEAKYDMVLQGARKEQIEALEALVDKASAMLDEVKSYQNETMQHSPIDGEVSKVILHPGELAATGYPILTLVDTDDMWASFSIREDMLNGLRINDRITVYLPAIDRTIPMKIFNISSMGDFATWKATTDKNAFDLKSFEIKARPENPVPEMRPGMTVRWNCG